MTKIPTKYITRTKPTSTTTTTMTRIMYGNGDKNEEE